MCVWVCVSVCATTIITAKSPGLLKLQQQLRMCLFMCACVCVLNWSAETHAAVVLVYSAVSIFAEIVKNVVVLLLSLLLLLQLLLLLLLLCWINCSHFLKMEFWLQPRPSPGNFYWRAYLDRVSEIVFISCCLLLFH
jgi:hypothetical protein